MPLTRGQIVGHDNERLAFAFTMMNDGETVQCQISDAAMDDLAETKGTQSIARQACCKISKVCVCRSCESAD
jgi:hypothetical protein